MPAESLRVPRGGVAGGPRGRRTRRFWQAVRRIRDNILEFQRAILHHDVRVERPDGVYLQQRYVPLRRVGICVPGGAAAYPSTVLMTAVPAQAAGVEQLAVVAPPTPFGADNPDVLATCHELGIDEVYRLGGAQAVAALAYGVEGMPAVDKIVGPGNLFVALAKRYVYGAGRYRLDRRAERSGGDRRRVDQSAIHGRRPAGPGRAFPGRSDPDHLVPGGAAGDAARSWRGSWASWRAANWRGRASSSSAR